VAPRAKGVSLTYKDAIAIGHNAALIGGVALASITAWLLCRLSGYTVAAWVAPLAISTFCLGLFIGVENTTKGPLIAHRLPNAQPHLAHRSVNAELRGDFERMRAQLKGILPPADTP
jgi:hypothetical protein